MVRLRSQPVNALHRRAGLANCRAGIRFDTRCRSTTATTAATGLIMATNQSDSCSLEHTALLRWGLRLGLKHGL
jgi:hypothetical protein